MDGTKECIYKSARKGAFVLLVMYTENVSVTLLFMGTGLENVNKIPEPEGVLNLSDPVWIKVNPKGEWIWNEYHASMKASYEAAGVPPPKLEKDEQGWTRLQLHEVMKIFGQHLSTAEETPFETNIRIKDPRKIKDVG